MKNEHRITWVSGTANGFYIDFETQTIGYSDKEVHLEYLQTRLLRFMLSSTGGYVTPHDISTDSELFSINLSKYIHGIKTKCLSLLKTSDDDDADALFDQIIEKKTINGKRGYRLRTELTDVLDDVTSEVKEDKPLEPVAGPDEAKRDMPSFRRYMSNNWLALFIYLFLVLCTVLLLDSVHITAEYLLIKIIDIPFGFTFIALCILSMLPVIGGLFADVPLALKEYEKKKGVKKNDLNAEKIHEIAMNLVPRFDNSREHVIFFSLCNITGAFTVASELLYIKSIPGIYEYLSDPSRDYFYIVTIAAGCFVALFNNYSLQTSKSPTRCEDDFILTRVHAFLNLIYLSVSLALGCSLAYTFLSYRFFHNSNAVVITPAYIVMILSMYCYLWFSSDSPAAKQIDSVSKNNFLSGLPVLAAFTTVYTFLCFTPDLVCILSILTAPVFLLLWFACLIRRKKENTIKLHYFVSSFFSILAIAIIVMLLLNFRW